MKPTFICILALTALTAAMPVFGATNAVKHSDAAPAVKQDGCASGDKQSDKQKKKAKPTRNDQQNKDYDRTLLGIYG
jgi:hypothetical protein